MCRCGGTAPKSALVGYTKLVQVTARSTSPTCGVSSISHRLSCASCAPAGGGEAGGEGPCGGFSSCSQAIIARGRARTHPGASEPAASRQACRTHPGHALRVAALDKAGHQHPPALLVELKHYAQRPWQRGRQHLALLGQQPAEDVGPARAAGGPRRAVGRRGGRAALLSLGAAAGRAAGQPPAAPPGSQQRRAGLPTPGLPVLDGPHSDAQPFALVAQLHGEGGVGHRAQGELALRRAGQGRAPGAAAAAAGAGRAGGRAGGQAGAERRRRRVQGHAGPSATPRCALLGRRSRPCRAPAAAPLPPRMPRRRRVPPAAAPPPRGAPARGAAGTPRRTAPP
jgi:hypothetical protein